VYPDDRGIPSGYLVRDSRTVSRSIRVQIVSETAALAYTART
jgi:hypothetical protein